MTKTMDEEAQRIKAWNLITWWPEYRKGGRLCLGNNPAKQWKVTRKVWLISKSENEGGNDVNIRIRKAITLPRTEIISQLWEQSGLYSWLLPHAAYAHEAVRVSRIVVLISCMCRIHRCWRCTVHIPAALNYIAYERDSTGSHWSILSAGFLLLHKVFNSMICHICMSSMHVSSKWNIYAYITLSFLHILHAFESSLSHGWGVLWYHNAALLDPPLTFDPSQPCIGKERVILQLILRHLSKTTPSKFQIPRPLISPSVINDKSHLWFSSFTCSYYKIQLDLSIMYIKEFCFLRLRRP